MTNENDVAPVLIGLKLKLVEIDKEIDGAIEKAPVDLFKGIRRATVIQQLMRVCSDRIGESSKALGRDHTPHEGAAAGVSIMIDCMSYLAFADAFVRECQKDHDD